MQTHFEEGFCLLSVKWPWRLITFRPPGSDLWETMGLLDNKVQFQYYRPDWETAEKDHHELKERISHSIKKQTREVQKWVIDSVRLGFLRYEQGQIYLAKEIDTIIRTGVQGSVLPPDVETFQRVVAQEQPIGIFINNGT